MRVIKNEPIVERKPVTIEFTPREVDLLYEICQKIGGDPNGPRGFADDLNDALLDEGAVERGLVETSYGSGLFLRDNW